MVIGTYMRTSTTQKMNVSVFSPYPQKRLLDVSSYIILAKQEGLEPTHRISATTISFQD